MTCFKTRLLHKNNNLHIFLWFFCIAKYLPNSFMKMKVKISLPKIFWKFLAILLVRQKIIQNCLHIIDFISNTWDYDVHKFKVNQKFLQDNIMLLYIIFIVFWILMTFLQSKLCIKYYVDGESIKFLLLTQFLKT